MKLNTLIWLAAAALVVALLRWRAEAAELNAQAEARWQGKR